MLLERKQKRQKITMLTAYDYPSASLLDRSQVDIVLIGDSLSMVVLGHDSTLPVGMEEMLHHAKAVARGCRRALVVGDMPYGSYQNGISHAIDNGLRFIKEGGCAAVKLEGGKQRAGIIAAMVAAEIPVMGHVGMTPQSMHRFGGFKLQGKSADAAIALMEDAFAVQEAGAFGVVLESIPYPVAAEITRRLKIPTIGIGAGPRCDGQVLVWHDYLGLYDAKPAKFVKRYANLYPAILEATNRFCEEVKNGLYPDVQHSYNVPDGEKLADRIEEVYGNHSADPSNEGDLQKAKI